MSVYFCSDPHLGHKNILKYRPQFATIEDHDNAIFHQWQSLTKHDTLFILGDFLFDCANFQSYLERIAKLPCKIKLIMGNHDSTLLYTQTIAANLTILPPLVNYKNFWLSHCPIHPQEMRDRKGNVHGHLHGSKIEDPLYFNVNFDNNNFNLVSLDAIKEQYEPNRT